MCFDLTHAPVATIARAAATGLVSMSTRPDPEGSGTVEIATWSRPRLRVVWDLGDKFGATYRPSTSADVVAVRLILLTCCFWFIPYATVVRTAVVL